MQQINYYDIIRQNATQGTTPRSTKILNGEKEESTISDLYSTEFTLKKALPITVQYLDQCYVLIQEKLNLGVEASTLREAESMLSIEVLKLYKKFSRLNPAVLGPYPSELLSYLKEYINETT